LGSIRGNKDIRVSDLGKNWGNFGFRVSGRRGILGIS